MQKAETCLRVQGRFPAVHRQCPGIVRTGGKFLHVIARSGATWQSVLLAVVQNRKAILWANPKSATNLPKQQPICRVSLRGRGLPHQCAHWFAMTCRRQKGVCACKDVARKVRRNLPGVSECRDVWRARCAEICRVSASARASPHCHCEERSDGAIRSPRSKAKRKAILWANPRSATNLP